MSAPPAHGDPPARRFDPRRHTALILQTLILALPALWIASRYRHTWYVYDEWSVIDYTSTHHHLSDAFFDFNGHLWVLSFLIYKTQTALFGLAGHAFVWATFCASLLAWAVSVRWLLGELRVPGWLATAAACGAVFGGFAGQNLMFEVQFAPNTAFALGFCAAAVVLRRRSLRAATAAAVLLTVAIGCDSAVALLLIAYVLVLVVCLVGLQLRLVGPLLVPAVLGGLYFLFASRGQTYPASLHASLRFGGRLVADSAGAPGGGLAHTGAIVLLLYAAAFAVAWTHKTLTRLALANLAAATCATLILVVSLMITRAAVGAGDPTANNRYLGQVGVLIILGALPICCSVAVRGASGRVSASFEATVAAVLVLAFFLNVKTFETFRTGFEGWNQTVKKQVTSLPCPVPPDARPLPVLSPQISGALLNQLQKSGTLKRTGRGCAP
ncbi:MAG: hypothetical protein QOI76_2484 [Frankiales bacterium]|nr:hypothetical protein [Frankiales bacterium]